MIIFVDRGSWAACRSVELAVMVATKASPWGTPEAFEPVTVPEVPLIVAVFRSAASSPVLYAAATPIRRVTKGGRPAV
jgi:hypothetical protein